MRAGLKPLIASCALALLSACGTPGAPVPPSLELPRVPQDLSATRKGSLVTLGWTPPAKTTDGQTIRGKYAGPTLVCRSLGNNTMASCAHFVGQVPPSVPVVPKGKKKPAPPARAAFSDTLPGELQQQHPTGFVEYAVQVENSHRRSAGLSNQVSVPLVPTLPPPPEITAKVTAGGIDIVWRGQVLPSVPGVSFVPRVYRRDDRTNVVDVVSGGGVSLSSNLEQITDTNFSWEQRYSYWITMVPTVQQDGRTVAEVEGDDSPPVTVFAHDVFPPAVPTGLEAVASGVGQKPYIDLTWVPDADLDLAGYNVYRQVRGATNWVKINRALILSPAVRDENVAPGKSYTYEVSAVDERGNESERSAPASESVP